MLFLYRVDKHKGGGADPSRQRTTNAIYRHHFISNTCFRMVGGGWSTWRKPPQTQE